MQTKLAPLILIPAAIVWLGFSLNLLRRRRAAGGPGPEPVPAAMRPGDPDSVIEGERIRLIRGWGMASVVFFAAFFPAYWLNEPDRMKVWENKFNVESIERGRTYFALRADPVTGEENLKGIECARCHGTKAEGGHNLWIDPDSPDKGQVDGFPPDLTRVFAAREKTPGYKDARDYVRQTIQHGRQPPWTGSDVTDMPPWGQAYGGPLVDPQIEDIVNWLQTIQKPAKELGTSNCGPASSSATLAAQGSKFDKECIALTAGGQARVEYENKDAFPHNLSIYKDKGFTQSITTGPPVIGGQKSIETIPALAAGDYFFRCDFHPAVMQGALKVQ